LFNKELTPVRWLSQPGQFLSRERVDLVSNKATLQNVAIIGPVREKTQVELSLTDAFTLGLGNVPLRQSGELEGTNGLTLSVGERKVDLENGVIIAQRHIHLDPKTATKMGLVDGQVTSLEFDGIRGGRLDNTIVRVGKNYAPAIHLDTDEANAMSSDVVRVVLS